MNCTLIGLHGGFGPHFFTLSFPMEIQHLPFTQDIPSKSGLYLIQDTIPKGRPVLFLHPYLCAVRIVEGEPWIQNSTMADKADMIPRDWHPISKNCGWWFSGPLEIESEEL